MQIIAEPKKMQLLSEQLRREGKLLGFVPTMGALHEGHLRLIRKARREADVVIVSIFVNPIQFNDPEDLAKYPRTFNEDVYKLEMEGVQILFAPTAEQMYPPGFSTFVEVQNLDRYMEGAHRPGHFRGVTTVVLKLFNITKPHFAVFGLKDAQQYYIVKRMVEDLNLDVEMVPHETVREPDGLAMSSRNRLLSPESRRQATALYRALKLGKEMIFSGERDPWKVKDEMRRFLKREAPLGEIDYVEIASIPDLQPVSEIEGKILLALAVKFPEARLIDNFILLPEDRLVWNERID
ncbi:MAG: pantoate--beta-alanine ligase [Thermotogae bacterium]|nr:pantoate--beta-alanine ligase [Thermotogota bacterium]